MAQTSAPILLIEPARGLASLLAGDTLARGCRLTSVPRERAALDFLLAALTGWGFQAVAAGFVDKALDLYR